MGQTPKQKDHSKSKKDLWDKAQIVSGFIASIVIAGVGILINIAIEDAQIASSKANNKAQIDLSERNNKAQLALTERIADIQRHLQEGTLTSQLVEHLASGSTLKKQLAIIVLRRSIPPEMYQDVITIIVKSDTDSEVRKTALEQARTLQDVAPEVPKAIAQAAIDSSRSLEERALAASAVRQIGLTSTAPSKAAVLSSSAASTTSLESPEFQGGIFTHYLLKGLSGEASETRDGNVRLAELMAFVDRRVPEFTNGRQFPTLSSPDSLMDRVIVGPKAKYSKIISVAIGNSEYRDQFASGRYAASDAKAFTAFWKDQEGNSNRIFTQVAVNATRDQMIQVLDWSAAQADDDSLALVYYSGQAITLMDGSSWLLPIDVDPDQLVKTAISTNEVRDLLSKSKASTKVLFIDAAFRPILASAR
jgi:hypothetical protein